MNINKAFFGKSSTNQDIFIFTLSNKNNMLVKIINYGATIISIFIDDKNKKPIDVVLGYDTIEAYEKQDKYVGAIIGRYANRIEDASFELNSKMYFLNKNDGENHLHGGKVGFDKKVWDYAIEDEGLVLTLLSLDGDEGYPGNVTVKVTYSISDENELIIDYNAISDADTVLNLTNHTYFNLSGHNSGDILQTKLKIFADYYTVNNKYSLPTGEINPVKGTPLDFTSFTPIGKNINDKNKQIQFAKGYDNNWVLRGELGTLRNAAEALDERSGIKLSTLTTFPGLQFYSANYLDDVIHGKDNTVYGPRHAFCLEAGFFPNSLINKNFPSPILRKDEKFHHVTIYKFETLK